MNIEAGVWVGVPGRGAGKPCPKVGFLESSGFSVLSGEFWV